MKAEVKKLECFPATVMEGVYVSGTGVTIQNLLDNDFIKTFIRKNSNKLKRFRVCFDTLPTTINTAKTAQNPVIIGFMTGMYA